MVQGSQYTGCVGRYYSTTEASRQATESSHPGRLHDNRSWDRPGRTRRDGSVEGRRQGDLHAFREVGECKTIETHHVRMTKAEPGDNIGFNIRGVAKNEIGRGEVMGRSEEHTSEL